jgi:hypothetical protein
VTGWEPIKEYANGALWVLPSLAAVLAVIAGYTLTQIEVPPGSLLERLAFQGTADDARVLLISVTSTVVTVIALVLGLTVVALQLSSTPRDQPPGGAQHPQRTPPPARAREWKAGAEGTRLGGAPDGSQDTLCANHPPGVAAPVGGRIRGDPVRPSATRAARHRLGRLPILEEAALTVLADAEREMQRPADLVSVREAVAAIRHKISARQAESS